MEMKNFRFVQVEDSVSDQCVQPEQHERCDPDKTVTLEHSDKDGGSAEEEINVGDRGILYSQGVAG